VGIEEIDREFSSNQGHLGMAAAKTIRRHGDAYPHRKAPRGHGDYFAWDAWQESPAARPVGSSV
jgi:hypothetical protein